MIITMIFLSGLIYVFNLDLTPCSITHVSVMVIWWCLQYFWIVSIYSRMTLSVHNGDTMEG